MDSWDVIGRGLVNIVHSLGPDVWESLVSEWKGPELVVIVREEIGEFGSKQDKWISRRNETTEELLARLEIARSRPGGKVAGEVLSITYGIMVHCL